MPRFHIVLNSQLNPTCDKVKQKYKMVLFLPADVDLSGAVFIDCSNGKAFSILLFPIHYGIDLIKHLYFLLTRIRQGPLRNAEN